MSIRDRYHRNDSDDIAHSSDINSNGSGNTSREEKGDEDLARPL